jgi:hypothetical protein
LICKSALDLQKTNPKSAVKALDASSCVNVHHKFAAVQWQNVSEPDLTAKWANLRPQRSHENKSSNPDSGKKLQKA